MVGKRVQRRRNEAALPLATSARQVDRTVLAVLEMQRSAGNRAVGRLLSRNLRVTPVDYNPESGHLIHSDVDSNALKAQIKLTKSLYNDTPTGDERGRVDTLGKLNAVAPDVPSLAVAIIRHLAGQDKGTRFQAISGQQTVLEGLIGAVA